MKIYSLVVIVSVLSACGGSAIESDSKGASVGSSSLITVDTAISGEWLRCFNTEYPSESVLVETFMAGGRWTDTISYFSDEDCLLENIDQNVASETSTGTYSIGTKIVTDLNLDAYQTTFTFDDGDTSCKDLVSLQENLLFYGKDGEMSKCDSQASFPTALQFDAVYRRPIFEKLSVISSNHEAVWTRCESRGDFYNGAMLTFLGGQFESYNFDSFDSNCAQAIEGEEYDLSGSYQVGSTQQLLSGEWVFPIDVAYANGSSTCYGIMTVQGDVMILGKNTGDFDCSSREFRQTNIEYERVYIRQ